MERAENIRNALEQLTHSLHDDNYGDFGANTIYWMGEVYSAVSVYETEVSYIKKENEVLRKLLVEKFS